MRLPKTILSATQKCKSFTENFDGSFIFRKHKDYYAISYISTYQGSSYKIENLSGKLYDATHKHFIPEPENYKKEQDKLIEIKH